MAMVDSSSLSDHINAMHLQNVGDIDAILQNQFAIGTMEGTILSKLSSACLWANPHSVTSLLEQGVDVNLQVPDGTSAAHHLCSRDDSPLVRLEILKQLEKYGMNMDLVDDSGNTPLLLACLNNQIQLVHFLIDKGCDLNKADLAGNTAVSIACRLASEGWYFWNMDMMNVDEESGNLCQNVEDFPPAQISKSLLKAGANPRHNTLLPSAILFSTMHVVKEFIDLGMDVNEMDENGRSPLGCACSTSHIPTSMVKLLLEKGADVSEDRGGRKSKPIITAFVHNFLDKLKLLLSYGATVSSVEMSELVSLGLSKWFLENPEIIKEESKELLAWKLLVKAGFRPTLPILSMKLKRISLCSSYPQVKPWIHKLLFPLPTLSECCRIAIRLQLQPSIDGNVDKLPLPYSLKGFLKFSEFV